MRRLATLIPFLLLNLFSTALLGQYQPLPKEKKWSAMLTTSVEQHDKRLYDFPQYPSENLLRRQPEFFGTYSVNLSLSHVLFNALDRVQVSAGIGAAYRRETFRRPYDPPQIKIDGFRILIYSSRRNYATFMVPLTAGVRLTNRVSALVTAKAHVNVYERVRHSFEARPNYGPTNLYSFKFYSASLDAGLQYHLNRSFSIGGQVRLLFTERNDFDLIVIRNSNVPRKRFDTYNPLALSLTVIQRW